VCPGGQLTAHRADFLEEMAKLEPEDNVRFIISVSKTIEDLAEDEVHLRFKDG